MNALTDAEKESLAEIARFVNPAPLPATGEPRLIGLCGYARSGKDSVGQILEDDYGFRPVSFAQALKNLAAEINPVLRTTSEYGFRNLGSYFKGDADWDTVKEHPEVRKFLQDLGVACRDQIGKDVWVDALARRISESPGSRFVVTDCRFFNEVEWIRSQGGEVWRVTRPNNRPVNDHISENALPETGPLYDRIIHNDGSLQDLRKKVLTSGN